MSDAPVITDETMAFARTHRGEDVRELALRAKPGEGVDLTAALEQIAGWNTARGKLPTWAACEEIWWPPHISMEQCSSEATARYKAAVAARVVDGSVPATLVDLTGGLGVDCSFMARDFAHAVYVERQSHLCALARHNFASLGLDHIEVIEADATDYLAAMGPVDLIYLDPARRDAHGARTYAVSDCTPDALPLLPTLLGKAPHVMIKLSPMLDWHRAAIDFDGHVAEVHIVSVANECKELLLTLDCESHETPTLFCVNDGNIFRVDASTGTSVPTDNASVGRWRYLWEPNASVMKAGCFDALVSRFDVRPIAPNSHLFVSETLVEDFPGHSFAIEAIATMNKRELKSLTADLTHANITTRNFPLSVADLRKRLKLKDGGEVTLFATTDANGRHIVIRARKA